MRTHGKKRGGPQVVSVNVQKELAVPEAGSIEEFISEHYWGYTKSLNKTHEYEVRHLQWETCMVDDFSIEVDFAKVYGVNFAFLNSLEPANVCFGKGSAIEVMSARGL